MFRKESAPSSRRCAVPIASIICLASVAGRLGAEESEFVPSGRANQSQRVDIAAGKIDPREFLRFLADYRGVAVIVDGASTAQLDRPISLVASISGADDGVVMRLLEANGWRGSRKTLEDGREVLEMRHDESSITGDGAARTTGPDFRRRARTRTPGAVRTAATTSTPDVSDSVYVQKGGSLDEVVGGGRTLVARGVAPDAWATVVVPLAFLEPKDAVATLLAVTRPIDPTGEKLVVVEALGAGKVILAGRASRVDYCLRLLWTLDDASTAERVIAAIRVEHPDVEALGQYIRKMISLACTPRERVPVDITPDARSGCLLIEAVPEVVESLRGFVRELGVEPQPARRKTHIHRLQHIEAAETASSLIGIFGAVAIVVPHKETNSLLIQAEAEDFSEILSLVAELDVDTPPRSGGPDAENH